MFFTFYKIFILHLFLQYAYVLYGQENKIYNNNTSTNFESFQWEKDSIIIDQHIRRYSGEKHGASFMVIKDTNKIENT